MSQSTKEQPQLIEARTIAQVPHEERHGKARDLFTIWFASNIIPLTVITGALGPTFFGLSFWWSLVAIVIGNFGGGVFMALHSAQGPRLGVPQMIQSRGQFGTVGAVLIVAIVVIMYVGFFASNLVLGGQSFNELTGAVSVNMGIAICGIGSLLICVFGYDMIHVVNRFGTFVFGAALLLAFVWILVFHGLPAGFLSKGNYSAGPFLAMTSIAALWQIAYAPYVSDYSRYMPEDEGVGPTFWASYWGCILGSVLPMVLGVIVGIASTNTNIIAGLHDLTGGVAWVILLIFVLGIIDTNSINLYGAVLCSITVGQTSKSDWLPGALSRAVISVIVVAFSIVAAIAGQAQFLANYVNFVLFLLYLLIPWTAINLVDYYLIRKGQYDVASFFSPSGGIYGRVNVVAMVVYFVGIIVELPFVNTSLFQGPISKSLNGADLAWLVGLAVTIPLYYVVARVALGRSKLASVA
jgi:NCS1 family nucleobase:cation symporter-1